MRAAGATLVATALLLWALQAHAVILNESLTVPMASASQPGLSADSEGRVYLSWVEKLENGHALRFAHLGAAGFGLPQTIATGEHWFVNWADMPGLRVLGDGTMVAWWLQKSAAATYSYDVRLVRSVDAGAHWSAPLTVHDDATKTEHGFVSAWSWGRDELAMIWLDGRRTVATGSGHEHGEGAMTLRAAVFDASMKKKKEWELDTRACDCCLTDAVATTRGAVVAYRDRDANEIRDIAITHWTGSAWSTPRRVHADNWKMPGCPVNGPALAARGDDVYLAWYTAADDRPQLKLAHSRDGGESFETLVVLRTGATPAGRMDIAVSDNGDVWVSWLDEVDGRLQLHLTRYDAGLGRAQDTHVATLPPGRGTGVPRLVASGNGVVAAWTDVREGKPYLAARRFQ